VRTSLRIDSLKIAIRVGWSEWPDSSPARQPGLIEQYPRFAELVEQFVDSDARKVALSK
jgi:hypothetical protein